MIVLNLIYTVWSYNSLDSVQDPWTQRWIFTGELELGDFSDKNTKWQGERAPVSNFSWSNLHERPHCSQRFLSPLSLQQPINSYQDLSSSFPMVHRLQAASTLFSRLPTEARPSHPVQDCRASADVPAGIENSSLRKTCHVHLLVLLLTSYKEFNLTYLLLISSEKLFSCYISSSSVFHKQLKQPGNISPLRKCFWCRWLSSCWGPFYVFLTLEEEINEKLHGYLIMKL